MFSLSSMEPQTPAPTTKPQPVTAAPALPPPATTKPQTARPAGLNWSEASDDDLKAAAREYGKRCGKRGGRPKIAPPEDPAAAKATAAP